MGATPLTDADRQRIHDLHAQGLTPQEIVERVGRSLSSVYRALKGKPKGKPEKGDAPKNHPEQPSVVLTDNLEHDGTIFVKTTARKPPSPEQLAELCNIDTTMWRQTSYRGNIWEGFYKLKNWLPDEVIRRLIYIVEDGGGLQEVRNELMATECGHVNVPLTQGRITYQRIVTEAVETAIKDWVQSVVEPLPPELRTPVSVVDPKGYWMNYGHYDVHIGMRAFADEVGENYDVKIAINRMYNAIEDMMEELRLYKWKGIVMPMGNDWYHIDSVRNTTAHGDHFLDVDSRFGKMFLGGLQVATYQIERSKEFGVPIDIPYIPGNHDQTSSFALCAALWQRYRNDPQVTVDLSMSPRKYRLLDGNLLGFAHGKDCSDKQWSLIIGEECLDVWSKTTYREVNIGHFHQKKEKVLPASIPTNGLTVVTHPALTNVDSYHFSKGLMGEPIKAVEARRYDNISFRGSHVIRVRDDRNNNTEKPW